jgi:hypothetical protein
LRFAVGARVALDDGAQYLVWPADRAAYGRLTRLLSPGRTPRADTTPRARTTCRAGARGAERHDLPFERPQVGLRYADVEVPPARLDDACRRDVLAHAAELGLR